MPDGKETSRQQPIQQILHSCLRTLIIHPQTLKCTSALCFLKRKTAINHKRKYFVSNCYGKDLLRRPVDAQNMSKSGFSLTRISPYKERIEENTGHRKPVFCHILCSAFFPQSIFAGTHEL